jgi:hypothetical protein
MCKIVSTATTSNEYYHSIYFTCSLREENTSYCYDCSINLSKHYWSRMSQEHTPLEDSLLIKPQLRTPLLGTHPCVHCLHVSTSLTCTHNVYNRESRVGSDTKYNTRVSDIVVDCLMEQLYMFLIKKKGQLDINFTFFLLEWGFS